MTSPHAIVTPVPKINQQIFASKGVINFQVEFGLADIKKWTKSNFVGR